jgi:two-component system nitrate/nitrite response regulator NarL
MAVAAELEAVVHVLVAADHPATRAGVRLALEADAVCTEAADVETAVEVAAREQPDVCIIDFRPPSRSVRAAATIAAESPRTAVVVLTPRPNEDEFLAATRVGARGYLSSGIDPSRLPHVIRGLMRGEVAVPRLLVRCLIEELRGRDRRLHLDLHEHRRVVLTGREWEVVQALRQGMSTKEIARMLGISEVTVRRHTSAVHQKLGVHSRAELLRALAAGGSEAA